MSSGLIGNRYRILRKIGEGGMAVVYIAVDEKLGRDIAIKILKERFESHEEIRVRFQHEARAISAFDHPNILKIFDFSGEDSRQLWIVTELIHGRNVAQIVETTPSGWLHPVIAASIVREICRALAMAHEHGVVHRDVKPENVMITHHGIIKLMDFGIAKIQRISSMTQTGMFMGSPSYMSPEQVRGRDVDQRSDIYSLGVLFYELVTGKLPFTGASTADIAMKILTGEYIHPRFIMAGIPAEIDQCIVRCLDLSPDKRPQSVEDVGATIDRLLHDMGLESSMVELERCFKDPKAYGQRLAKALKETDAQLASAVVSNDVAKWNNEAIASPIPRPDISGEHLPMGSHRRDHQLPPRFKPHFGKKQVMSDAIADHLPERRHQQRPTVVVRNTTDAIQKAPPAGNSLPISAINGANLPRDYYPPSRVVPLAPKKIHKVRYIVHEEAPRTTSSNFFGQLAFLVIIAAAGGLFWVGSKRNFDSRLGSSKTFSYIHKLPKFRAPTISKFADPPLVSIKPNPAIPSTSGASQLGAIEPPSVPPAGSSTASVPALPAPQDPISRVKTEHRNKKTTDQRPRENLAKTSLSPSAHQESPILPTQAHPPQPKTMRESPIKPAADQNDADDGESDASTAPNLEATKRPAHDQHSKPAGTASMAVSSIPAAELFIDSKRYGTTNDQGTSSEWIELPAGPHKIELHRSGYSHHLETINIANGQKQKFGPYVLLRGDATKALPTQYRLTLSTNNTPADVKIVNLGTHATQNLAMTQDTQSIALERGTYEVTMSHKGVSRRRRIDFTGATQQLTFSVEFKE